MQERQSRAMFTSFLFVLLILAATFMLFVASTVYVCEDPVGGCHRSFDYGWGIPGILLMIAGVCGLLLLEMKRKGLSLRKRP